MPRRPSSPTDPPDRLGAAFFARPTVEVARDLVGCALHVDAGTPDAVVARIVEVEAYLGVDDPASHAHRGPTPRARIMYGPPARLYVYLSYGVHHCANLVTEPDGRAGAVLLRGARVESGEEVVRRRRLARHSARARAVAATAGCDVPQEALLRGPGNLCSGLGLDLADNGLDVTGSGRVAVSPRLEAPPLVAGRRVGISRARDEMLRFAWRGEAAVSAPPVEARRGGKENPRLTEPGDGPGHE